MRFKVVFDTSIF